MENRPLGICTFFGTENYGSNLQALGLYKTLEKMGFDVYMLDKFHVTSFLLRHPLLFYARVINKINAKKNRRFFNPEPYEKNDKRIARLKEFKAEQFKLISFHSKKEWENAIQKKMIFVAGGDILWNPSKGYPAKYFLDFAYYAKLPRFSYGSSVGELQLPQKYHKAYRRYLGSMKAVGVREESVALMLEKIITRKVTRVPDPSLLLTGEEWSALSEKAEISIPIDPKGFLLCYFVMKDKRYWDYVKKAKEATGMQVVVLPMHKMDEQQPYDIVTDGTPYEFIWLIKNAEMICTDSFHACVFSMMYKKEFYLLPRTRKAESAKYNDFLNRYHLIDRLITDETCFERRKMNYTYASQYLEADRKQGFEFLEDALFT